VAASTANERPAAHSTRPVAGKSQDLPQGGARHTGMPQVHHDTLVGRCPRPELQAPAGTRNLIRSHPHRPWARAARTVADPQLRTSAPPDSGSAPCRCPARTGRAALSGGVRRGGWHTALVARSGDLAYTYGNNEFTAPDASGQLVTTRGRYLTVWRKEADGRWRCVEDYSSPAPLAPPATADTR
jgi:hypothetical protein